MADFKTEAVEFFLSCGALQLKHEGFTYKSKRKGPHFFNTGVCDTGRQMSRLAMLYAHVIVHSDIPHVGIYGPAYKGIPLATAIGTTLWDIYGADTWFGFNRKEEKDHGDKGQFVGSVPKGRILMVDDVTTDGATKLEAIELLRSVGANPVGLVIAFDRQERAGEPGTPSAVQTIEQAGVPVLSILKLEDLLPILSEKKEYREFVPAIAAYLEKYKPS